MFGRIVASRMSTLAHPIPKPTKGTYPVPNNDRYKKLMDMQTHFCAQDGKMVWQKLPKDAGLYYLTVGLVSAGFLLTLRGILVLATPPKNG